MSGNISLVKQMPNKTIVASNMVCVADELRFFTYRGGGGIMGSDSVYTRMKTDGTILNMDTKILSAKSFLPFSGAQFSPILIGMNNIIAHSTNIMSRHFLEETGQFDFREIDIENFPNYRTHSSFGDSDGFPRSYFLCQFLKNDKDFLFAKYLDMDGISDKNLRRGIESDISLYHRAREADAPITQLILVTQKK
jgi:hypothetical protein